MRTAPRRPGVRVRRTRGSARSRTIQRNVFRTLVDRAGVCTNNAKCACTGTSVPHRHRNICRRVVYIVSRDGQRVFVRLVCGYLLRHVECRLRNSGAAQPVRVRCRTPRRPGVRVRRTRGSARSRTIQRNVFRTLVDRAGVRTNNAKCACPHRNPLVLLFRTVTVTSGRRRVVSVRLVVSRDGQRVFVRFAQAQVEQLRTASSLGKAPRPFDAQAAIRSRSVEPCGSQAHSRRKAPDAVLSRAER